MSALKILQIKPSPDGWKLTTSTSDAPLAVAPRVLEIINAAREMAQRELLAEVIVFDAGGKAVTVERFENGRPVGPRP